MKKILVLMVFFVNLMPYMDKGYIQWNTGSLLAQAWGKETVCDDPWGESYASWTGSCDDMGACACDYCNQQIECDSYCSCKSNNNDLDKGEYCVCTTCHSSYECMGAHSCSTGGNNNSGGSGGSSGGGGGGTITFNFTIQEIIKHSKVTSKISDVWSEVKAKISERGWSYEAGFWIFKAPDNTLYVGETRWGEAAAPGSEIPASILAGSSAPGANGSHIPAGSVPVTFIHTHTPMTYATSGYKYVGVSVEDKAWADKHGVDIAVYDYKGEPDKYGNFIINAGHNINDAAQFYIYKHQ